MQMMYTSWQQSCAASGSIPAMRVICRTEAAMIAQETSIAISAQPLIRMTDLRASSFSPAPRHCPTMVIRPSATPSEARLSSASITEVIPCAAIASVPIMETED